MARSASETQQEKGAVGKAASGVADAASTAQEKVGEKATELRGQGRERLREELDSRTTSVGQDARSLADTLRDSTDKLRSEGKSSAASMAEQVADRVERLGSYLERSDGDTMLRDVERFARNRPWAFAGLGAIVGLAAARFMKASSDRRYETSQPWSAQRELPAASYEGAEFSPPGSMSGSAGASFDDPASAPLARAGRSKSS